MNIKYIPGDLITSDNNPNAIWKVEDVLKNEHWIASYRAVSARNNIYFIKLYKHQINPVPLTPWILEINGWVKVEEDSTYSLYEHEEKFTLWVLYAKADNKFNAYIETKLLLSNFKYIHQLQHLLFGLGLSMDLKV